MAEAVREKRKTKPKKHKEKKKQVEESDVDPVPKFHQDVQAEKKAGEGTRTKQLPEVEKDEDKTRETVDENESKLQTEIGQKETVETLDTGQLKPEKQVYMVENRETDVDTGQRESNSVVSGGLDTGQEKDMTNKGAYAQDMASQKIIEKGETESLKIESFYSAQEQMENKVVKDENESQVNDVCKTEVGSDIDSISAKVAAAVIKPSDLESKLEHSVIESEDKGNVEAGTFQDVATESKYDIAITEPIQAIGESHVKETVIKVVENKDKTVNAEASSETDNVAEVSEDVSGMGLGQRHLYPDLTKDIEQYKAELEQASKQALPKQDESKSAIKQTTPLETGGQRASLIQEKHGVPVVKERNNTPVLKELQSTPTVAIPQTPAMAIQQTQVAKKIQQTPIMKEKQPTPAFQERVETRETIQPLTIEQLNSLYYNQKLEQNDFYIDKFVEREQKREGHEFYEIILNYQRARRNFLAAELALESLEREYGVHEHEVWITEQKIANVKGKCGDGFNCTANHAYEQAVLNRTALSGMKKSLEGIQELIETKLSLHSYSAQLSRLQVESYIHNLFITSPALRDIPKNLPVYGCERQSPDIAHQVSKLRDCVTVLFSFHRQPTEDEEFIKNLEIWTERLVSALLRVSTFDDHLFILNHILRCPAGVGTWASQLVQVPAIPSNQELVSLPFGNQYLDHLVTCLSTLLVPTRGREQFLCQMQKMFTPDPNKKGISWVMVDSDGEEDEDPQNAWIYLHENDIVAVLKQLPIAAIFRHVFFVTQSQYQDKWEYDIKKTSEASMFRLFAFCTCLIKIFGYGLETYNKARYRQLNKRLGRMIRQTVQYVSDHWECFELANQGRLSSESYQRLQMEFDAFFLRAVNHIYMSKRLGCWQFIADMPFNNVSKATMWKLLWLLHQSHGKMLDVSSIPPVEKCVQFIQDPESRKQLSDVLQFVPASEGIYLLNTMTNMTECCSPANADLINAVTLAVFEVSYICPETRDTCSKMGRELLSAVVICHPFIVSLLLERVFESMDHLGPMGLYLFTGLPLDNWLPSDPYLTIVRQWLLTSDLGSFTNQLAQLILGKINWGTTASGDRLMVPWNIHKQVAMLVVEAYQVFILGKNLGSVIMEGVKQMTAAVQQHSTNEQEFNSWCWDLILKLSLHRSCLPKADLGLAEAQGDPPDLHKDDALLSLVKGIKDKNPTACCVALLMSTYGHSIASFISDGIPLLQTLTDQGLFKAVLCAIHYVVPLFYGKPENLLTCYRFHHILHSVLQADESYFKVVRGLLSYDFPGPITKLLICVIQSQVSAAEGYSKELMISALSIWTKLIMKIPKWYQDRNCCCGLDHIIETAFSFAPAMNSIYLLIQEQYKKFCQEEKNHGVVSSLVSWVTSGVTLPSFIEKTSYPECSWLMYMLLTIENQYERDTTLWTSMQDELLENPKMGVDQALKKCIMRLKLDQAPTLYKLSIYKFAQQALDMPHNHPMAVLTWQKFFICYLGRSSTKTSLPQRASIGERFFTGLSYSSMLKKMKKRLGETADFYTKQASNSREQEDDETEGETDEVAKQIYNKLARIFQTFQLWLEEPLLHDASLYLPSLPQQYQSDRLLTVFQNQTTPWLEYLNIQPIREKLVTMATAWRKTGTPDQNPKAKPAETNKKMNAEQRILSRLARCDDPLPPPPLHNIKAPVPDISPTIMEDKAAILHLLESDLNVLVDYARQFCNSMSQHSSLDHIYLELVPQLYTNVSKQVTVSLECTSMINPLHRCSNPGSSIIKIEEKWNDPIIQRQSDENRAEYKQMMIESKLPPAQNVVTCAVHTENAITLLVKLFRGSSDQYRCSQLSSIACSLFFRLAEIVTENTQKYPPTQQFFSSCIDILGQEFIRIDPSQTELVLAMALGKPSVAGLMAPHLMPTLSPQKFVPMYDKLMKTLQGGSPELTFMLLTKFDVSSWLSEYNPSKAEVREFINILGHAFVSCGAEPDSFHQQVLELYLGHERRLLSYKFPFYLHEITAAILQGSSAQKVSVACWEILHSKCFKVTSAADEKNLADGEAGVHTDLSTEQVRNLLLWFAHEFTQARQNKNLTFGLYSTWQRYVPHVAAFIKDLSKCYIYKLAPSLLEAASNDGIEMLWRHILEAFSPWIQTFFIKGGAHVPWIETDKDTGAIMVKALTDVVAYAHSRTAEIRGRFYNDFLSLLWLFFADVLCKPQVLNEVVAVYNMEFAKLPWQQLLPSIQVMETLARLKENGNSLGFNLVADIVSEVNWGKVMQWYKAYHPPEVKSEFQKCLLLLFIQAFTEKKHVECPDMERVLVHAETFNWQYLTSQAYQAACAWLLQGCDPKCLLVERSSPEAIGLRILKSAACFTTQFSTNWSDLVSQKRLHYLHCIVSLLCQCTFITDCDISAIEKVVINLLTEIETIESAISDLQKQREESTDMMKEVLSLLNNGNPDGNSTTVVMTTVIQWFHDSPQTGLLVPCIHSASRCLASLSHMTQIVEECIQMYFVSAKQKNDPDPWGSIMAVLQFPELGLTEFFGACLQEGAYLLLYCYTLQRVPLCQSVAEEQGVIEIILDWTERVKPNVENESKLLLWWNKALTLVLRQIDYGRDVATCVHLVKKIAHKIQVFGEDRAHSGLLGAIGLGKKSALSEKFRLTSRALTTFCDSQLVSENQLRLEPTSPSSAFPNTKQEIAALIALKTNKKYQAIKADVEMMCEFVTNPNKCIGNVLELLQMSKAVFYSDKEYLTMM